MENNQYCGFFVGALVAVFLVWLIKPSFGDPNSEPVYKHGFPANCRAIIQANIDGFYSKEFSCYDAMQSISRNCGINGSSWGK